MFNKLWQKLLTFEDHHQAVFAIVIGFGILSASWGIEKLFDTYFFPQTPVSGYIFAIILGASLLWLTKHIILHED